MKNHNIINTILFLATSMLIGVSYSSCTELSATDNTNSDQTDKRTVSKQAKEYWYDGTAEISSYKLSQSRYGELHEGTAVLVYVTEPFSKKSNTKADRNHADNIPVLKLNKTLKWNTGIYPYSMMSSSFFPFENENAALKISSSVQEWCGMTYLEMKNENNFKFKFDSYFEGQTYKDKAVNKNTLEDDMWSLIRLNPELLPVGEQEMIPAVSYLYFGRKEPKAYKVMASLDKSGEGTFRYQLNYPSLERKFTVEFNVEFPHEVIRWEDTHQSGYGAKRKVLTSKAEVIKTIKSDYWNKHNNKDAHLRAELGLK